MTITTLKHVVIIKGSWQEWEDQAKHHKMERAIVKPSFMIPYFIPIFTLNPKGKGQEWENQVKHIYDGKRPGGRVFNTHPPTSIWNCNPLISSWSGKCLSYRLRWPKRNSCKYYPITSCWGQPLLLLWLPFLLPIYITPANPKVWLIKHLLTFVYGHACMHYTCTHIYIAGSFWYMFKFKAIKVILIK